MFSCEFCEISKNTFFTEHLWTTASEFLSFMDEGSSRFTHVYFLSNAIFQLSYSATQDFVNFLSANPTKMVNHA